MSDRLSPDQWSQFWEKGSITTFLRRFNDNYDGAVQGFWDEQFAALSDGARILDLATGNGALTLLACRYAHHHRIRFHVTGVDSAAIAPLARLEGRTGWSRHLKTVRFLARTPIEETGLPDDGFDLITSQFGLEYADTARSVREIDRVLDPVHGRFAALLHHSDSAIVREARDGIRQVLLCEKSGAATIAADILERMAQLATRGRQPHADKRAETLRAHLNERLAHLERAGRQFRDPGQISFYLKETMAPFHHRSARLPLQEKLGALRNVSAEIAAYRRRMRDLISSACDAERLAEIERALKAVGLSTRVSEPFVFEGVHFAHQLVAQRSR